MHENSKHMALGALPRLTAENYARAGAGEATGPVAGQTRE
ncbi:hypothetical protein GCM10011322_10340 [Salinarimonas ramus]|uniref:Uncharacterized protein n=1 Tax=Salinarimonas ramus TaxID=690164 RepID=A0A917Q524_9HYPH|nr:hypothetical protein GCM10011322_10340 [Salinarimonas ramus]